MSSEGLTHWPLVGPIPDGGTAITVAIDDPDDTGDCVQLASVADDLARLIDPDEIVIGEPKIVLVVDYPIKDAVAFELAAASRTGFTRAELVTRIGEVYAHIYRVEAETSTIAAGYVANTSNRSRTTGTFGIWGHDLDDLVIEQVYVNDVPGAPPLVTLAIGS